MQISELNHLLDALPKEPVSFQYFADRYALMLLEWAAGDGRSIQELKSTQLEQLLRKDSVRQRLAKAHGGKLNRKLLTELPPKYHEYRLTWGRWEVDDDDDEWVDLQMSRACANLSLQINFPETHDDFFGGMLSGSPDNPFRVYGHPTNETLFTMAWARLDFDSEDRHVLIEEIQNDWIKEATALGRLLEAQDTQEKKLEALKQACEDHEIRFSPDALRYYLEFVLAPHIEGWDETTLAAVLWTAREQLKAKRVYMHTYSGGCRMKDISPDYGPPRALYTRLPRRFCFQVTKEPPPFLTRESSSDEVVKSRLGDGDVKWFVLDL